MTNSPTRIPELFSREPWRSDALDLFVGRCLTSGGIWTDPRTSDGISSIERVFERGADAIGVCARIWEIDGAVASLVAALVLVACSQPVPGKPNVVAPVEGAEVGVGALVQSQAVITLDVLIPPDGDVPAALETARQNVKRDGIELVDALPSTATHSVMTVELSSVADEWNHRLPGFVASKIDRNEFPTVDASAAIVRLDARAPAARAWQLVRAVTTQARDLASAQHGWIYDPYRAELHSPDTFATSIPDLQARDVRALTRIMGVVNTHGGLDHVRSIGLWRLGLPELYLPDVRHADLDDAMDLVRATAQTLIQNGGVTSSGVIAVDLSKLPHEWPRPAAGSGRFTWRAHWMRGPIHQKAMLIVLSTSEAADNAAALSAALHDFAGTH